MFIKVKLVATNRNSNLNLLFSSASPVFMLFDALRMPTVLFVQATTQLVIAGREKK